MRVNDVLDAVRRVLATQPDNRQPLSAKFVPATDESEDPEIVLVSQMDGRRHVIGIQIGETGISVDRSCYETIESGEFKFSFFSAMEHGATHRSPSTSFEADLHRALDAAPDGFAPTSGPGVATHPFAALMVDEASKAAATYNEDRPANEHVRAFLNAEGPFEGEDVVTFVREDGTAIPLQVRTRPGGANVHNVESGELLIDRDGRHMEAEMAEWIVHCLEDAQPPTPAP